MTVLRAEGHDFVGFILTTTDPRRYSMIIEYVATPRSQQLARETVAQFAQLPPTPRRTRRRSHV
jgi:hypothetical protein